LAEQSHNPAASARAMKQLMEWVNRPDWVPILDGYARCLRIVRSAGVRSAQVLDDKLVEPEEKTLSETVQHLAPRTPHTVNALLSNIEALLPAITAFFDKVLVMDKDEAVKQNRLALVGQIANLSAGIADLSKLEGF